MPKLTPLEARKKVLGATRAFYARHNSEPGVARTFGYFVRHPVSGLNQKRLLTLLSTIQALGNKTPPPGRLLRVLDVACGAGLVTSAIASLGHRALGVELDPEEFRLARLFAQEHLLDALFIKTDVLGDAPWEKQAEDVLGGKPEIVVCAYALHHLLDADAFLQRMGAWLPSGSWILVNEENPRSPLFALKHRVRGWLQADTDQEWHRDLAGWTAALERAHFKVAEPTLQGLDPLPGLSKLSPARCWSLVFAAQKV